MYQLWLDDLYPRAKFADALAMVEKVGHTRRMQIMRKDWIDEGKPRRATEQEEHDDVDQLPPTAAHPEESADTVQGVDDPTENNDASHTDAERRDQTATSRRTTPQSGHDPDEDELDALLAEGAPDASNVPTSLPSRTKMADDDPFADEMEAMADMEEMW